MSALSIPAALALAMACAPSADPHILVGIAQQESGLDPGAVHANANGSTDVGLMQINDRNFAWLGLTPQTALDPCQSLAAAARLLASFSRYNTGSPTRGIVNGYAGAVLRRVHALAAGPAEHPEPDDTTQPFNDTPSDEPEADTVYNGG